MAGGLDLQGACLVNRAVNALFSAYNFGCFLTVTVSSTLPEDRFIREVGLLAVWTVTSAKPGNGVELLRDGREDTYWQSDGSQPHLVNIQFQKKVRHHRIFLA
jgi:hypothetical protein